MPDPGGHIGFEQLGIGRVLRTSWLHVPLHQREYSWTDREVQHLFHDINRAISEDTPEYFLGSIVTIPRTGGHLEVVDGQQRLATTAILLAAIRDYLRGREQDEVIVRDIGQILMAADLVAREERSRLRLNVTDNAYFEQRVLQSNSRVPQRAISHRLIDQATELASEHVARIVSAHDPVNHGDVLVGWINYLERSAIVGLLKVPSEINAYRMFETLNDRGLRTSQSDLVKNYLFGQSQDRINEAQAKWSAMRAVLESFEDDDVTISYLRQMLVSLYGPLRANDVYETVAAKARGATQSISFLSLLESGALDYAALLNPQHEKWNGYPQYVRQALRAMNIVRFGALRPIMLAVARKFDPAETAKAMRLLLSASVRLMIAGGATSAARSGSVETALGRTAKSVSDGEITTATGILSSLDDTVPKDPQFVAAFSTATVSKIALARYYLRSLEMAAKNEADPCFLPNDDAQVINLEHVLPRKTEGNWPQFTEEQVQALTRRIGNFALLQASANSTLKSAPFEEKAAVYRESPYVLTSQIAVVDNWTPDRIKERQDSLANLAARTWPLSVTG